MYLQQNDGNRRQIGVSSGMGNEQLETKSIDNTFKKSSVLKMYSINRKFEV